ncbi:MAG: polymer-forming cytoskeletal protein [Anaerolineales bacterium]|nr:polymer-forming cytoskeletal protein [Anaerolineales bacterium]
MFKTRKTRTISLISLVTVLVLVLVTPVAAFEYQDNQEIVIGEDEVIDDDFYALGETVTVDGTIKGDLVAFGSIITINGTVEGDLISAGQEIIINGIVEDDARIAGSVLYVGENAKIGDDIIGGSYSLELKEGSSIGGHIVYAGAQALLAGEVAEDVLASVGGLEITGTVAGDVEAEVGTPEDGPGGPPPSMFMSDSTVPIPSVDFGLTIGDSAKIGGDLIYTSERELSVPEGPIDGKIKHIKTVVKESMKEVHQTPGEVAVSWFVTMLRHIVTLLLAGLLIAWLFPKFLQASTEMLQNKPWPSLGWGVAAGPIFIFAALVLLMVIILLAMIFGVIQLGGISTAIVFTGLLVLFALVLAFVLAVVWIVAIITGTWLGKWIFTLFKSDLAEHRFYPMLVGVLTLAILISVPFAGWLLHLIIILFGLGVLWQLGSNLFVKQAAE